MVLTSVSHMRCHQGAAPKVTLSVSVSLYTHIAPGEHRVDVRRGTYSKLSCLNQGDDFESICLQPRRAGAIVHPCPRCPARAALGAARLTPGAAVYDALHVLEVTLLQMYGWSTARQRGSNADSSFSRLNVLGAPRATAKCLSAMRGVRANAAMSGIRNVGHGVWVGELSIQVEDLEG